MACAKCKNLFQEYAQKMNYTIPFYICIEQPSGFIYVVEVGGKHYTGVAARTKKKAEMIKAAHAALLAIHGNNLSIQSKAIRCATHFLLEPGGWVMDGQCSVQVNQKVVLMMPKSTMLFLDKGRSKETDKKPVKKRGSKRKWKKRKFMEKLGE